LLALSERAPAELKVMPLPNPSVEEFALMDRLPEEVVIPLFKFMPELAVRETAPAAVKLPVIVILVGAFNVNPAVADIPPVIALKLIEDALFRETPLAKAMLSFGSRESTPESESPFKLRAPVVVVILELTVIPFTAFASRDENEESAEKTIAPSDPDKWVFTSIVTPSLNDVRVTPLTKISPFRVPPMLSLLAVIKFNSA